MLHAVVQVTFLQPPPLWSRQDQHQKAEVKSAHMGSSNHKQGIDTRFAPVAADTGFQHAKPHWVRNSGLTAAVVTSDATVTVRIFGLCALTCMLLTHP